MLDLQAPIPSNEEVAAVIADHQEAVRQNNEYPGNARGRGGAVKATEPTLSEEREYVNILYYGEPGVGKTTALAFMAQMGQVIFVDSESGLKAGPLKRLGVPTENIIPRRTVSYSDMDALHHELKDRLTADPDSIVGVVLDSLSEIQRKILEQDAKNPLELSQRDYGTNTQELRLLIRHFRDLPCHVGFTAHVRRDQDEDDGTVKYGPSLTPAVGGDLLGYVDLVCYLRALPSASGGEEPDVVGAFRPVGKYRAKDRFGALPPLLFNPTFPRVAAYIDGTYRREAQLEADQGEDIPAGLDPEQYDYRQRVAAAKAATLAKEEES